MSLLPHLSYKVVISNQKIHKLVRKFIKLKPSPNHSVVSLLPYPINIKYVVFKYFLSSRKTMQLQHNEPSNSPPKKRARFQKLL